MALSIFFSHGSADREWVQRIAGSIEDREVRFYLYERDAQLGHALTQKIEQAIQACDIAFVLLTRRSRSSAYVQQEIGFAKGAGKLVVPLVEKGLPKKSLAMLENIEYVPFDKDAVEACVTDLSAFIVKQLAGRTEKTVAGLSSDQWIDVILIVAVAVLALYLVYTMTKGSGQG